MEWLRGKLSEFFYSDMGNAGADGHCIRIMSKPGLTFPLLIYLSMDSGGAVIEQMKFVVFLNGRWFDLTALLNDVTDSEGNPDLKQAAASLLQSDLFSELLSAMAASESLMDFLKALALDVKNGETVVIPAEGLEKIDLSTGIMNQTVGGSGEPNNRKSRPKLP